MRTFDFNEMKSGAGRVAAVNSGACLVEFTGSGSREVQDTCILLNVTGLSEQSINELAGACVKSVKSARVAQGE